MRVTLPSIHHVRSPCRSTSVPALRERRYSKGPSLTDDAPYNTSPKNLAARYAGKPKTAVSQREGRTARDIDCSSRRPSRIGKGGGKQRAPLWSLYYSYPLLIQEGSFHSRVISIRPFSESCYDAPHSLNMIYSGMHCPFKCAHREYAIISGLP